LPLLANDICYVIIPTFDFDQTTLAELNSMVMHFENTEGLSSMLETMQEEIQKMQQD